MPLEACNSYYMFDPNFAANLAFAVLFGISLSAHIVQAIAWRKVSQLPCILKTIQD